MLENVKAHILRNRGKYEVLGVVVIAGVAYYVGVRSGAMPKLMIKSNSVVGGFNNKINMNVIEIVERQGPPSWVIKCVETGEEFLSQRATAFAEGIRESTLRDHLNGYLPDANGKHYVRLGIAAA